MPQQMGTVWDGHQMMGQSSWAPLTSAVPLLCGWGEGEGGELPFGLWAQGFTLSNETGSKYFKM